MNKSDKKDFVFEKLSQLLKPQGYYLVKTGLDPRFVLKKDDLVVLFFFNFKDMGEIAFSKFLISLPIIEDIMFDIKKPNQDYNSIDNKKYFLITIEDLSTVMPEGYYKGIGYETNSQEQLEFFTNWTINYLENEGKNFVEKYSYLPNILIEMDRLEVEGKYWNEILSGGPEFLFRGLIISKLCNDNDYLRKLDYAKELLTSMANDYLPFYEKLKNKLDTLTPIYNVK